MLIFERDRMYHTSIYVSENLMKDVQEIAERSNLKRNRAIGILLREGIESLKERTTVSVPPKQP
jgi:metal-responsive CopG/Arc/MetJ family transcriptional regulator